MKSLFQVAVFSTLLIAGACGREGEIHVLDRAGEFPALVEFDDKIDILFVVDNSLSMETKQRLLADAFQDFISKFNEKKLDYQIGVISTETFLGEREKLDPDALRAGELNYFSGTDLGVKIQNGATRLEVSPYKGFKALAPGALISWGENPRILTANYKSTPEELARVAEQFKQNVKLCASNDPNVPAKCESANPETGMRAILAMLDPQKWLKVDESKANDIKSWNAGFFRPDSRKAIIIVSDEDESHVVRFDGREQSPYFNEIFKDAKGNALESGAQREARVENYLREFKSAIESLNPKDPERTYFAVVVVPSEKALNNLPQTEGLKKGAVGSLYMRAAKDLRNKSIADFDNVLDITKESYGEQLSKLGERIVKSFNQFIIKQEYVKETLVVTHIAPNGTETVLTEGKDFKVEPHKTFKGQFLLTIGPDVVIEPGSSPFRIVYTPLKPAQ